MINQNRNFKIALIGDCLANGGAEKVHALLSIYFEKQGLEVHNCIFMDWISYEYSGSLLNLGKTNADANSIKRKIARFRMLRKFFKTTDFDAVIDFRIRNNFWQEIVLSNYCYPKSTYYTVHSAILSYYFPKLSTFIYKNKSTVAVSKAIQLAIISKDLSKKVFQIYNPIDLKSITNLKDDFQVLNTNYILAVGRMNNDIKQFDKLIIAYSKSVLPKNNIKLVLLGDGQKLSEYKTLSAQAGVENLVELKGFLDNPFPYYKNALFSVLCSKNEGFPNVILESLAVGTPVISFDCFSGPNEIIVHKHNGLLVANQQFDQLTAAMNLLASDTELRDYCKQNAKSSSKPFDIETIGKQWLELLKIK